MKCQLVATVHTTLVGTPIRKKGDKRLRSKYPVTRAVIYYIKLWHLSFLRCGCSPHVDVTYNADATDSPGLLACAHIQWLYGAPRRDTHLTPLGHEMFDWRYAAHALKETR